MVIGPQGKERRSPTLRNLRVGFRLSLTASDNGCRMGRHPLASTDDQTCTTRRQQDGREICVTNMQSRTRLVAVMYNHHFHTLVVDDGSRLECCDRYF